MRLRYYYTQKNPVRKAPRYEILRWLLRFILDLHRSII